MIARRTRLLVLTSTFPRWPGDTTPPFVADLCAGLARSMDVTVLAPASAGAAATEQLGAVTVRRFRYGWPASTQRLADGAILPNLNKHPALMAQVPPFMLAELAAAWRLARRERFDAVHAHWVLPQGLVAAMLKRVLGLPVLITSHGSDLNALSAAPAAAAKGWALRRSDRVTVVSRHLRQKALALGVSPQRITVLPMGTDTDRFSPAASDAALRQRLNPHGPALLFVGRLAETKGARYAIEAMPRILRAQPAAHLAIIGDGPERAALDRLVTSLAVAGSVSFLGALPHRRLPAYFASADLLLGPSITAVGGASEAFGLVFAESLASGCAVVASVSGGIDEIVDHEETGLLVPEADSAALAAAAVDLLADAPRRSQMGALGVQRIRERFDRTRIEDRYAAIIEQIAA